MSRDGRLAGWLLAEGERPMEGVVSDPRLLVRRLLLAEVLAKPPGLRSPSESSPLSPVATRD